MPDGEDLVTKLIFELKKLPGIGPRSAERIAFHILVAPQEEAMALAHSIRNIKKKLRACKECFNASEGGLCPICSDPMRDIGLICVVEQLRDLVAIERAGVYHGLYHVLLGVLSPVDGVTEANLTIKSLINRVKRGEIREVILATNPTMEGDNTALRIWELLQGSGVKISRLARGVAAGGQLGYASGSTLADAIEDRRLFAEKRE